MPASTNSATASRHALFWLMLANAIGLLMALTLWQPAFAKLLGSYSYGRWVPLHLNLQLYGWSSLPLIGWLLHHFRLDHRPSASRYVPAVIWLWSAALLYGAYSWLTGHTSGKIFLDWKGPALALFITALFALWLLLTVAWFQSPDRPRNWLDGAALLGLFFVPISLLAATSPDLFPPVNEATGGPTGSSLLGSTLIIIALLLILPPALAKRQKSSHRLIRACWLLFIIEFSAFAILERQDSTHHDPLQIIALGSLLPWTYLLPRLWSRYQWRHPANPWRRACFLWFFLLVLTGWISFLPGILDRLKFTNGLVAHAHLAMAGFTTSFLITIISEITPAAFSKPLRQRSAFWAWNLATLGYILLMWTAGWIEGADFGWLIHSGSGKSLIYALRCLCGATMLATSIYWWHATTSPPTNHPSNKK